MASGFLPFGKSLSCLSSLVHAIDRHRWNSLAFLITFKRLLKKHTTLEELLVPVKPVLTKGGLRTSQMCSFPQMPKHMCIVQPSSSNLIRPCKQPCFHNLASHVSFTTGKNKSNNITAVTFISDELELQAFVLEKRVSVWGVQRTQFWRFWPEKPLMIQAVVSGASQQLPSHYYWWGMAQICRFTLDSPEFQCPSFLGLRLLYLTWLSLILLAFPKVIFMDKLKGLWLMLIRKESLLSYLKQDLFNQSTMHLSPTVELFFVADVCWFWP